MADPLRHLLAEATRRLRANQVDSPRLEAEILLSYVLKKQRFELYAGRIKPKGEQISQFYRLIEQRSTGIPLPYLTGKVTFMGLVFKVSPACFLPRPETEQLVEHCLAYLKVFPERPAVLDIGTGCGAIALSIAYHFLPAQVIATDISVSALALARYNRRSLGLTGRVKFFLADLYPPGKKQFHLIVSNPPYIPSGQIRSLPREVKWEPWAALDGGPDGLKVIRQVLTSAGGLLLPGGYIFLEIGYGQDQLLRKEHFSGLRLVGFFKDFSGVVRFAVYHKN
ncbi:MAG: peptide chain release factor N(5)-glutamine methyltransferase [Candidatus Omnitrophica bacterium]|nr:peptide chain release factor N(5)-glutamine methyltransferase [Candidatus Omnitrophota bacterium]